MNALTINYDECGTLPIQQAAFENDTMEIKWLLKKCVDVNGRDNHNRTALHYAAASNSAKAIKLLVDSGADVNAKDDAGNAPLHYAVAGDQSINMFGQPKTLKGTIQ